jgi:hypothetical protein
MGGENNHVFNTSALGEAAATRATARAVKVHPPWLHGPRFVGVAFALLLLAPACALAQTDSSRNPAVEALQAQLEMLQGRLPDTAHVMTDVDYHASNLWFAAKHQNWPLAEYYLGETLSHLNWAVRIRPVRKLANGADLDLQPILKGIEETSLAEIKVAVSRQNTKAFELAYRKLAGQCYGCHAAAEKPFLRVGIPESPGSRMIQANPNAPPP